MCDGALGIQEAHEVNAGLSKRRGARSEAPSVELSPVGSNELRSFADANRELRDFA